MACRLSLGIPSSLLLSGLALGTKCIREVVPDSGAGARVIMEAGYMLLGAMCIALPQDIMDVRMHGYSLRMPLCLSLFCQYCPELTVSSYAALCYLEFQGIEDARTAFMTC